MIRALRKLVANNETPKAIIELMKLLESIEELDYLDESIQLSSRQKELKQKVRRRTIDTEKSDVFQNQISSDLLDLLREIESDDLIPEGYVIAKVQMPEEDDYTEEGKSLDQLKERVQYLLDLLRYLKNEEMMTLPGKGLFALENQISNTEKEIEDIKIRIRNLSDA